MMMQAIELYRANFKPSAQLDKPYVMLGFNVFAADTDDEAHSRATSMQQAFVNLRSGRPTRLQPPVRGYLEALGPQERRMLDAVLSCSAIGSPTTVAAQLKAFIAHTARRRADDHLADFRSRGALALVRDHGAGARSGVTAIA